MRANRATFLPHFGFLFILAATIAHAQVIPQAVVVSGEVGTGLYMGEFNSLQYQGSLAPHFGLDFGFTVRYNIAESFALMASFGHSSLPYGIGDTARLKYASNFFGPVGATTYPGSTVAITPQNHISINRYVLSARSYFNSQAQLVPYFTLGLGLIDFTIKNDSDQALPTNQTGDYEHRVLVMPVGGGVEYHFNDRLALFAQGLFYVNSTDYLDGYAHYIDFEEGGESVGKTGPGGKSTPPDYFATLTVGLAWTIHKPSPEEPEPPPPPPDEPRTPDTTAQTPRDTAAPPADSLADPSAMDTDGDGLSDRDETTRYMTDPNKVDTDNDNLSDFDEVKKYNTSPNNKDTDNDGLTDGQEAMTYSTNPLNKDSDGDGLRDGQEVKLYKTDPLDTDTDKDELRDGVEVTRMFTNPLSKDTDGDGLEDGLDQCPLLKGTLENNGCPKGMAQGQYSEQIRKSGPLAGLPEVPLEGDRTDFSGIYFKVNSDNFDLARPETMRNLQQLLNYMKQCEEIGVRIEGHTSSEGNPTWNQQLSEKRAQRVRDWLIANGVAQEKILGAVGYGSTVPRVPEPEQGTVPNKLLEQIRKQNRRITTMVEKPCQ